MVLKIALDEHNIDGLTPAAIAKVLTDKFRVSATGTTVGTALARATSLVNRVPNGGGFNYRIMAPGQEYLNGLASPGSAEARSSPKPRSAKRGKAKPKAAKKDEGGTTSAATPTKPARTAKRGSSGTPGPKAALLSLATDGFFDTGKTVQAMQAHLKTRKGFTFDPTQLRVALLRLVRDQALDREENAEKEYEYKRK
jgi:hypothetical protein